LNEERQLAALSWIHRLLAEHGVDYWLFGGWAVDFHAGAVTRAHDDLDLAVWSRDAERVRQVLTEAGWSYTPEEGYAVYEQGGVRLEVAARDRGTWPAGSFGDDTAELNGVRARIVSLPSLKADKGEVRDDPDVAAKDRADSVALARLTR
jgi:aminoglycoside-2''-adenylyltransferase